jgi:hypothetical protein
MSRTYGPLPIIIHETNIELEYMWITMCRGWAKGGGVGFVVHTFTLSRVGGIFHLCIGIRSFLLCAKDIHELGKVLR